MRKHASEMIAKHSTMVNASVSNATMWPLFAVLALVALQAVVNMTAMVWYFYSRRARHNTYVLCLHLAAPRTATLFVCALCVGLDGSDGPSALNPHLSPTTTSSPRLLPPRLLPSSHLPCPPTYTSLAHRCNLSRAAWDDSWR